MYTFDGHDGTPMCKVQGEKRISTSPFIKTQQPTPVYVWHQILCIYLCFQPGNPIPKRKVLIIIKFYKEISTYQYRFNNGDIVNVRHNTSQSADNS